MPAKYNSKQLKSLAKGQMLGHYSSAIAAEVTAFFLLFAVSYLCSSMTDPYSLLGYILGLAITFIIHLFQSVLLLGLIRYYLNRVTGRNPVLTDVFSGFSSHADRVILAKIFLLVLELLCFVPFGVAAFSYLEMRHPLLFVLSCFLLASGIVGVAYLSLTYSQINYLFLDFPGAGVKQVLRMSHDIMKGNKARLFYIEISFIPYDFLGILSFGIAYLWIIPFKRMVRTNFYLSSV